MGRAARGSRWACGRCAGEVALTGGAGVGDEHPVGLGHWRARGSRDPPKPDFEPGDGNWLLLADPEGHLFCISTG
ncbi:hypothetical protein BN6_24520 [Saccharothrix espanaensis DSM 44229]|uniref:Uncharacterized protein n=1 Tax=Saccharothrix espanaensis (strain ATCC 51144 / DSM 44229 / JCM 9112 / NBRC 15066 / NRRL 15764) TaxID=1179773 RepID=K0JUW8_SACES|nr:hypothetical protein BN6_24520 [Saccharothrix espanaensis DSM 44229]